MGDFNGGVCKFGTLVYINGIFNVVFLEEFGESSSVTSWAGAAQVSLLNVGGELRTWLDLCSFVPMFLTCRLRSLCENICLSFELQEICGTIYENILFALNS